MTTNIWSGGRLVDLTTEECWALLRTHAVGRVAWSDPEPQVVPVNFAVIDERIWIQSRADSRLAAACDGRPVAFEVDEVDDFTRSGVSVVAHGTARARGVEDLRASSAAPTQWPDSWPEGDKPVVLSIEIADLTGRRLLPS